MILTDSSTYDEYLHWSWVNVTNDNRFFHYSTTHVLVKNDLFDPRPVLPEETITKQCDRLVR